MKKYLKKSATYTFKTLRERFFTQILLHQRPPLIIRPIRPKTWCGLKDIYFFQCEKYARFLLFMLDIFFKFFVLCAVRWSLQSHVFVLNFYGIREFGRNMLLLKNYDRKRGVAWKTFIFFNAKSMLVFSSLCWTYFSNFSYCAQSDDPCNLTFSCLIFMAFENLGAICCCLGRIINGGP